MLQLGNLLRQMKPRKIAILGTSNSIMRAGWATFFSSHAPKDWEIENLSLGGNCALFMPGQSEAYSVPDSYDICIIELPINDQRYVDSGFFRGNYFAATLAGLFAKFSEPGSRCIPIVLSIPTRTDMAAPIYFGNCETILSRICAAFGVAVFDVGASIRAASFTTERKTDDFFSDKLHLLPSVQRHIASALLRRLKDGLERPTGAAGRMRDLAPKFRTVMSRDVVPKERLSHRRTSISGFDVIRLAAGESVAFPAHGHLCGILHWADKTAGEMDFVSGKVAGVRKLLRKEWPGGIFFFTHLRHAMPCGSEIVFTSDSGKRLPLEPSINPSRETPSGPLANEIAYAVFCDRDPDQSGRELLESIAAAPDAGLRVFDPVLTNQLRVIPLA